MGDSGALLLRLRTALDSTRCRRSIEYMTWRWKASVGAEASSPSYSRKCRATQLIASRLPVSAYSPPLDHHDPARGVVSLPRASRHESDHSITLLGHDNFQTSKSVGSCALSTR